MRKLPPKTYTTMMRFTEKQKQQIYTYCDETGMSISSFIRMLIDDFFVKRGA